ncbi:MAG TPA: hypothetical protein VEC06_16055 [Paucimonas sp.]|nr:hypothetical protein [Paucimonas sp.]
MVTTIKEAHVRTKQPGRQKVRRDPALRLPHERDEADDSQSSGPRDDMKQAYEDIERGLVDTDFREQRGVEEVVGKTPEKYPGGKPPGRSASDRATPSRATSGRTRK